MSNRNKFTIPLALRGLSKRNNVEMLVVGGDIGGTKPNLAVYEALNGLLTVKHKASYPSADYTSVLTMLDGFLAEAGVSPVSICLGVAGPVMHGKVKLTNLSYTIDSEEIARHYGLASVTLINDLEATAYGLPQLDRDQVITLIGEEDIQPGNMAILAPGTGLGEAGLFWDGECYRPFATEGGHCNFAPRTDLDVELFQWLRSQYGVVSWERVLSGPGIASIHQFLVEVKKRSVSAAHAEAVQYASESKNLPALISGAALENAEPVCIEAMQLFVQYLAHESANLVLKMKATGGLLLGGGIPPKISSLLTSGQFTEAYLDAGAMRHLIEDVPVYIINNDRAALLGAGNFAAYGKA